MRGIIKRILSLFRENKSLIAGGMIIGDTKLVSIGKNVTLSGNVLLYANAPITIGDNTIIALNTIFHTSTHDTNDHPMWKYRIDKPISVGKHVWVGVGSIILPGVMIGDYAVVGAGSVVTANVPEGAIVAGNPARIIKQRKKEIYSREPDILTVEESCAKKGTFLDKNVKEK